VQLAPVPADAAAAAKAKDEDGGDGEHSQGSESSPLDGRTSASRSGQFLFTLGRHEEKFSSPSV
jgi:hypothetical protein